MIDQSADLLLAFSRVDRFRAALDRIAHTVRLRAPAALPKWVQRQGSAVFCLPFDGFRHDREAAADASESAILREAAKLNRAFSGTRNLENRVWDFCVVNV